MKITNWRVKHLATNITLCIPAYGNQISLATFNTSMSLMQMFMSKGIRGAFAAFSYPEVSEARNILLTAWYDNMPDSTHLLFIDSDMGFDPSVVIDFLTFNEPMVGALYTRKTIPIQWAASGLGDTHAERRGDFMKVAGLGMGCFLIRRDAIDIMLQKMPELSDERMQFHAAKDMLPKRIIRAFDGFDNPDQSTTGRLSEDLAFCCRWRQCGGDVWAAMHHTIEHVGMYSYKGNYLEHIAQKVDSGEVQERPPSTLVDVAKAMAAE
jgi:hypothetical protein